MQNLLYALGLKKKSRREKVQDAVTDTVHSIADSVDELVDDTRRKGPRMARRARKRFKAAEKGASKAVDSAKEQVADAAESVSERVSDAAESVRDTSTEARERVSGAASSATADASAAVAAAVAALASLNLDWEAILKSLHRDVERAVPEKGNAEQAGRAAKQEAKKSKEKAKAKAKKRKGRKFPGFWIWLLRLGIGYLFVERLRSRDIPAYVDHEAADQMRQQAQSHPVAWYKDLLDTLFIPNASIFAAVTVAAEVLAALGLLTGVNRRLSALLGLAVAGNDLLAEVQDADERGQNVLLVLAQLLLLRTGG